MNTVSQFPYLKPSEFEASCKELSEFYFQHRHLQSDWLSADVIQRDGSSYLKITKALAVAGSKLDTTSPPDEIEDHDEEALVTNTRSQAIVEYDIILSPTYQVPVLYFSIKDPSFRFPPTMENLYRYLIPAQFKTQADHAGVLGGITVTDHPLTNTPVYFIHPCQTAAVLEASVNTKDIPPLKYLTLWMGAMCNYVGLSISTGLATKI